MKKETYQGLLCCMAGITVAAIVMAFVFRMFRFPGGEMLMYEIVPVLLIAEGIGLLFYIAKHGLWREAIAAGNRKAELLRLLANWAIVSLPVIGVGLLFRGLHFPSGATILMIGSVTFAFVSLVAGFLGASMLKK